jgi:hypothetical protein
MTEQQKPKWLQNKNKYNVEYVKNNVLRIELKINRNTEAEIVEHLEQFESKQSYIKQLIIEDIAKKKI